MNELVRREDPACIPPLAKPAHRNDKELVELPFEMLQRVRTHNLEQAIHRMDPHRTRPFARKLSLDIYYSYKLNEMSNERKFREARNAAPPPTDFLSLLGETFESRRNQAPTQPFVNPPLHANPPTRISDSPDRPNQSFTTNQAYYQLLQSKSIDVHSLALKH